MIKIRTGKNKTIEQICISNILFNIYKKSYDKRLLKQKNQRYLLILMSQLYIRYGKKICIKKNIKKIEKNTEMLKLKDKYKLLFINNKFFFTKIF